jgi:hypothetical protein
VGYFTDHAGDGQIRKYRLYFISLNTPVYWTDSDIDITWNGHTWIASPITQGAVNNQPSGATASFSYGDADGSVFTSLAAQNGGELAVAAIYEAGFLLSNQSAIPDEVLEIFSGRVDRVAISTQQTDTITFTFMPPALTAAATLPTRLLATLLRS